MVGLIAIVLSNIKKKLNKSFPIIKKKLTLWELVMKVLLKIKYPHNIATNFIQGMGNFWTKIRSCIPQYVKIFVDG